MTSSGLSIEAQFLLAAANTGGDQLLRTLAAREPDWNTVLEMSVSEGAQPTVARRLRACQGLPLPAGVPQALDHIARITELRMQYVRRRLYEILDDLGRAGIPVVLLKGAALAHWAYGSFGERYMSDLDLLVRPGDAGKAHALLQSTGWKLRFREHYDRLYAGMHHLMPLVDARAPAMQLHAEIHTALIPVDRDPFLLNATDIWREARNLDGLPNHVRVPSSLHALWHTCVHYAWSHMFTRGVRTFQDVAALARSGTVDWSAFVSEAKRTRAATCCYWTLALARSLARAPVPEEVLRELQPATPVTLRGVVTRHLENEVIGGSAACPSLRLQRIMWSAAVRPRRSGHGANRPWSEADWNEMLADQPQAGDAFPEALQSSRRFSAWIRYLRTVLPAVGSARPARTESLPVST